MKKILSWSAFILGFILIICAWFLLGDQSDMNIFTLNIVVSLIVYCLLASDFLTMLSFPSFSFLCYLWNMAKAEKRGGVKKVVVSWGSKKYQKF